MNDPTEALLAEASSLMLICRFRESIDRTWKDRHEAWQRQYLEHLGVKLAGEQPVNKSPLTGDKPVS